MVMYKLEVSRKGIFDWEILSIHRYESEAYQEMQKKRYYYGMDANFCISKNLHRRERRIKYE